MIRITKLSDLKKIENLEIYSFVKELLEYILKEYFEVFNVDLSIQQEIGAIYVIEQESDLDLYEEMELAFPIEEYTFEWLETIEHGYCNGCILLDNDRGINLIGRKECFTRFKELIT